ncbi:MAG: tRNA (adenosine(37)-N6)-threonylcarbamoyltransferase complex dimerization subunit type 1 TsaB [Ferruginibacter sp.]
MATIINIDSSLETASVSIATDGIIKKHLTNEVQKQHASFIHVAIQSLLTDVQINITDIDAIACTVGPGSYTGLRVGLAAAKGICYALDKPLLTINTLHAMAHAVYIKQEKNISLYYCPMIDARRMEVYTALYEQDLKEITPAHAVVVDENFCDRPLKERDVIFCGNGMQKFKKLCISKQALFEETGDIYSSVNILSYRKYLAKEFANLAMEVPLYAKEFYNP